MTVSSKPDGDDDAGCLFIVGAIIIAIAIGNIWNAAYGWLALGCLCIACALVGRKT